MIYRRALRFLINSVSATVAQTIYAIDHSYTPYANVIRFAKLSAISHDDQFVSACFVGSTDVTTAAAAVAVAAALRLAISASLLSIVE